jgi:DNA-directed RNA polymerase subunit alpha
LGTTVGNSLRRILLSTIEGAAVTKVKLKGASHEFTSLPGVQEDVTDIIMNIKNLVVQLEGDEPKTMRLDVQGPGEVNADLIEADTSITIHNRDMLVATLTVPASELKERAGEHTVGEIYVDAIFSPVLRVRYKVEDTRVGQRTNYDKLTLEIWTNGAVTPEMALVEAAKILRKHLNPFVMYYELGEQTVSAAAAATAAAEAEQASRLDMPISDLDLSVRASNCLDSAGIRTVGELTSMSEDDLLKIRSFGKTSLREIRRKLEDLGMSLAGEPSAEMEGEEEEVGAEEED